MLNIHDFRKHVLVRRAAAAAALLLILPTQARAQAFDIEDARARYTVTSWTEHDGMPSSYIRAIAQDRDGSLWLATYSGLVRFDGMRFSVWKPQDESLLPSEGVSALLGARDGSLWVGVFNGVTRIVDGRIDARATAPDGFFNGYVSALYQDRKGQIWAAAQNGLARFDGTRWSRPGAATGLPQRSSHRVFEDSQGRLWIGTGLGLFRQVSDEYKFERVSQISFAVEDLAESGDGRLVVAHPTRLITMLDGSFLKPPDAQLERSHGTRLLLDSEGHLWIGTRGRGVIRARTHGTDGITFDPIDKENGLSADSVVTLFEDRERNIWVGTPYGLNRLSRNTIIPVPLGRDTTGHVRAITQSTVGTWVATEESLLQFSGQHRIDHGWTRKFPNHTLIALCYDERAKRLWVASNQGLVRIESGKLAQFPTPGAGTLQRIRSLTIDKRGRLWLADVDRGVYRATDASLTKFELIAGDQPASTVFAASDDRVWIGFTDGSLRSYHDTQIDAFSAAEGLPGGGSVTAIHEDRSGTLWVGTHGALSRYMNGRFVTLTRARGFPGPGPVSIADDAGGNLWMGVTGLGIVQLNPKDFEAAVANPSHPLKYRLYGPATGLRGTPVRAYGTPTVAQLAGGEFWFLTSDGLGMLDPRRLAEQMPTAPVVIDSVLAENRSYAANDRLALPPNTSAVQIDYRLQSLTPRSEATFRYRLDGFDTRWIDAGRRREAVYTNLPPGPYQFVVEAGGDDPDTRSVATWRFSIQPTFYQTAWFPFACVFAAGLGVWGLWRLRLGQVQRRFAVVLEERVRMGREIHDTLLQGLVGVSLQFKVIADQLDSSPDAARQRLDRLRKLVEEYVYETRRSIWDLRSPALERCDLPTALKHAGEAATADNNVRFDFITSGSPYACPPKVEEHILRVGREALMNAVLHGRPTLVTMELVYQKDALRLRIVDDGAGFEVDHSVPGIHWGVANMRDRARQMNADFDVASTPGKGTRVELLVRVPRDA
jgi:signal transduction histidine kinase/ligand-binding sensor domain-containing protein